MLTKELAENILSLYKSAWEEQNVDKILSIFAKDGIYQERSFEKPHTGHQEIAHYWREKVIEEQSDILLKILHYYICDDVLIAEWDVSFTSKLKGKLHLQEIAVMKIEKEKIISYREYWHSEKK